MSAATLLIVEDDGILAANLEIILTGLGYRVLGPVATGEEAIALLGKQSADLVLMDIELAGTLNGIETAEAIGRSRDIPIVFLTGFSHDPLLDQAKIVAPYGYLIKPVPERELAATVAMSLHRHALDRELRENRKALAASEARYRHLFDNSPLGIFRTTLDGRALMINSEMARMLGCDSVAEAIDAFTDLARQLYVDPTRREEFVRLLRMQGVVRNFEYQARKRDGDIIWISMDARLATVDGADGTPSGQIIDGFALDITERKRARLALEESERRHRYYLENTPYGVFATNAQGRYLQVNPSACRITGFSEAELLTMGIEDILFEEDKGAGQHHFHTVLREGWAEDELPFRTKSGERRWWSITAVKADDDRYLGFCNDVTERRQAEERLRESEANFRSFFASMTDMCLVANLEGRILAANDALSRTLGYSGLELTTMRMVDLHAPDKREEAAAMIAALLKEEANDCRLPLLTRNGEQVPVVLRAWFGNWNGRDCIYGTCRNLTSEQEAEQRFEHLFRHSPALMALNSARDRRFVDVNDVWLAKTGYTRAEVIGQTPLELHLFPVPVQYEAAADRLRGEGRIDNLELQIRCKDGSTLFGLFSGEMVRSQGRLFFLTVMIDITERKRMEEALRQEVEERRILLDNIQTQVWYLSDENTYGAVNLAHANFSGFTVEEMSFRPLEAIFPKEVATACQQSNSTVFSLKEGLRAEEWVPHASGERRLLSIFKSPVINRDGSVNYVVCSAEDITDRRRAEEEKRALQAQLLHAQKLEAIGTLAGGIAHDFNNILAAVIGYADMARDSVDNHSTLAKDLDNILKAGHRAKDLVKQILAFSRQNTTEPAVLFPALIVKEVIKLLRPSLPTTIAIEQDIDPKAGPVMIDPTNLHQMLMNLCTNAFHAMEERGGVLKLGLRRASVAEVPPTASGAVSGDYVVLTVADTGTGIPESIRHRIFDPFFTTKGTGKGTGMGLAILHGLVSGAGGWVELDSSPGIGSTFRIFLPVAAQPIAEDRSAAEQASVGSGHILFVDDEAILTEMAKTMLEQLGYLVTARTSSLEALATFQNHPDLYDLVITDQTMPGMTGMDLARRLLILRPELPIILCTGYSGLISRDQARAAGIRDLALKPLTKKELASLIKKVLYPD